MPDVLTRLRATWQLEAAAGRHDFTLLQSFGRCYAARNRRGEPAFVVPLANVPPGAVGRMGAGFELTAHPSLHFEFEGKSWDGAAAALSLKDVDVVESFAVLAADVVQRLADDARWSDVVAIVSEWQELFAPRGKTTAEAELGLWGELWFIAASADVDSLLLGWRGPERDATDFFLNGRSAEVKTSRLHRVHRVSQSQVSRPVGDHPAWLLSLWVKADPASQTTVSSLAELIVQQASDQREAWRRLGGAGYREGDRRHFATSYALMEAPEWYPTSMVPRVREADVGVSDLRYRVELDDSRREGAAATSELWRHFHGRDYGGQK
jgi:hypothetical protein